MYKGKPWKFFSKMRKHVDKVSSKKNFCEFGLKYINPQDLVKVFKVKSEATKSLTKSS